MGPCRCSFFPLQHRPVQERPLLEHGHPGRVHNLYSIWRFKKTNADFFSFNSIFVALSLFPRGAGNRNGTCFTASECADRSGAAQGNCAAGCSNTFPRNKTCQQFMLLILTWMLQYSIRTWNANETDRSVMELKVLHNKMWAKKKNIMGAWVPK